MPDPVPLIDARVPLIDGDSQPYWDAAQQRKLTAQQCAACGRFVFYPRAICPFCHSLELAWREVAGAGSVYSYTISRRAPSAEFADHVPIVVVLVDLNEGYRMMSNLVGPDALDVRCGDRVQVDFQALPSGQVLPVFTRVSEREEQV
jgi:uncharacterized OB-fold protein